MILGIYASFIKAAVNTQHLNDAEEAFEKATSLGLANFDVHEEAKKINSNRSLPMSDDLGPFIELQETGSPHEEPDSLPTADLVEAVSINIFNAISNPISSTSSAESPLKSEIEVFDIIYKELLRHEAAICAHLAKQGGDFKIDLNNQTLHELRDELVKLASVNRELYKNVFSRLGFYNSSAFESLFFPQTSNLPDNPKPVPQFVFSKLTKHFFSCYLRCAKGFYTNESWNKEGTYLHLKNDNHYIPLTFTINNDFIFRLSANEPVEYSEISDLQSLIIDSQELLLLETFEEWIFGHTTTKTRAPRSQNSQSMTTPKSFKNGSSPAGRMLDERGLPENLFGATKRPADFRSESLDEAPPKKMPNTSTVISPQENSLRAAARMKTTNIEQSKDVIKAHLAKNRANDPLLKLSDRMFFRMFPKASEDTWEEIIETITLGLPLSMPAGQLESEELTNLLGLNWLTGTQTVIALSASDQRKMTSFLQKHIAEFYKNSPMGLVTRICVEANRKDRSLEKDLESFLQDKSIPSIYREEVYSLASRDKKNRFNFPETIKDLYKDTARRTHIDNLKNDLTALAAIGFNIFNKYEFQDLGKQDTLNEQNPPKSSIILSTNTFLFKTSKETTDSLFERTFNHPSQRSSSKPMTVITLANSGDCLWSTVGKCGSQNFRWLLLRGFNPEKTSMHHLKEVGLEVLGLRADQILKTLINENHDQSTQNTLFSELIEITILINKFMSRLSYGKKTSSNPRIRKWNVVIKPNFLEEVQERIDQNGLWETRNNRISHVIKNSKMMKKLIKDCSADKGIFIYLTGPKSGALGSLSKHFEKIQRALAKAGAENVKLFNNSTEKSQRLVHSGDFIIAQPATLPHGIDAHTIVIDPSLTNFSTDAFKSVQKVSFLNIEGFTNSFSQNGISDLYFGNITKERLAKAMRQRLLDEMKDRSASWYVTLKDILNEPWSRSQRSPIDIVSEEPNQPLKLTNKNNNCFLNSAIQAIAALKSFRESLNDGNSTINNVHSFQKGLRRLLNEKNRAQENLMIKLFTTDLHPEFDFDQFGQQLDAASAVELLTEHFLPQSVFEINQYRRANELPGLFFETPPTETRSLPIAFPEGPTGPYHFSDLVNRFFDQESVIDEETPWKCTVKTGKNEPGTSLSDEIAHKIAADEEMNITQYTISNKMTNLPDILNIHLKRFDNNRQKLGNPVHLPADGILEIPENAYASASENRIKYRLKSYIVHEGTIDQGHYTAYVEINDRYYKCDDTSQNKFEEIDKNRFLANTDAYYLVLERITE